MKSSRSTVELEPVVAATGISIWDQVAEHAGAGDYRPQVRSDLTCVRMKTRHGLPNIMLADRPRKYLRLSSRDDELVQLMDGSRRVADLVVEYFRRYGSFGFRQVTDLVTLLRRSGFLTDSPRDIYQDLGERLHPSPPLPKRRWMEGGGLRMKFPVRGIDGLVTRYHDAVGGFVFTPVFLWVSIAITVIGLGAFIRELVSGRDPFAPIAGSGLIGVLALVVAYYVVIFLHESAHALTCKHFGRMVPKGGFMLYYLMPAFYVDVTDAWLEPWQHRIAIFWAGPYSGFILAGASALGSTAAGAGLVGTVLFKLAVAAYLTNLLNLMPLLLWDGYWILEQWLEIPDLRVKALTFIKGPLWTVLWTRHRLTGRETFFAIFGLLSAAYSFASIFLAYLYWRRRLGPIISPLWLTPGLLSKVIAVGLVAIIGVPLGMKYGRRLWGYRRVLTNAPAAARKAIFTIRMSDRLRLLEGLAFLRTVPQKSLERLAGSARVREVPAGATVVRQGDRGDEFFILAAGQAAVLVREQNEDRIVGQMTVGDFFGERALLKSGVREATVRAETSLKLLVFPAKAFWAQLAGPVGWESRIRGALEERDRLRTLPMFADTAPRQLDLLAVKMRVQSFAPGEVLVKQGDPGDAFYIVRGGSVEVIGRNERSRRRLATLKVGDFFGEIALLRNAPRNATVRGLEPGSVWRLERHDFRDLLGRYLDLEGQIADIAASRTPRGHSMRGAA
ncbi:MAG: cyclic nucleotide-binding domain-containing protein [Candidatus Dormibacteraeota bacterium]|nr:cyclic nucleotide-binding domain-containing protein [Candidatus Dormibacteraeota bacterium]